MHLLKLDKLMSSTFMIYGSVNCKTAVTAQFTATTRNHAPTWQCNFRQKHDATTIRVQITRNSSGDEIANVNFLYDDIVHVLQNTIDSCINSATNRRGYVLERMFTKFSEITQYNGHYAVQGHSRSPILVPIESSYTTSY